MPVTIDITQDLRYRQGVQAEKERMASIILKEGFGIAAARKFTGLEIQVLEKLALQTKQENSSLPQSSS